VSTTLISGKELAEMLAVSGAALSKATRNGHQCAGHPVAEWAERSESGRVLGFHVPPCVVASAVHATFPDNRAPIPGFWRKTAVSTPPMQRAPNNKMERLDAELRAETEQAIARGQEQERKRQAQMEAFADLIVLVAPKVLTLAKKLLGNLPSVQPGLPPLLPNKPSEEVN